MILEAIVTTRNADGTTNVAPMGPHCHDSDLEVFELRPFCSSTTYRNLKRTGQGVLHVTDDVLLFVNAAISHSRSDFSLVPGQIVDVDCLQDCCRRYEFETTWINDTASRAVLQCRSLRAERVRDFFGFNRARHAVIEACILATRIDFLPHSEIRDRLADFETIVGKTGGPVEVKAFEILKQFVADHNSAQPCSDGSAI